MELRLATALVGACVRAAAQAHVPRRTLVAVAASSIAAAFRGNRVEAAPVRNDGGQLEAKMADQAMGPSAGFAADRASAIAGVREARAAGRQRRRQAKRVRRAEAAASEKMEVEGSLGEDVPASPPEPAQATDAAPATTSRQAQAPTHDGTDSAGSVLPSPPSEDAHMAVPGPGPSAGENEHGEEEDQDHWSPGSLVQVSKGSMAGASGVVSSVNRDGITICLSHGCNRSGGLFTDYFPGDLLTVEPHMLTTAQAPTHSDFKAHGRRGGHKGILKKR